MTGWRPVWHIDPRAESAECGYLSPQRALRPAPLSAPQPEDETQLSHNFLILLKKFHDTLVLEVADNAVETLMSVTVLLLFLLVYLALKEMPRLAGAGINTEHRAHG